jgi:hypothetical protein
VPQLEVAEPEIGPAFDRLEQVARDERLCPRTLVMETALENDRPVHDAPLVVVATRAFAGRHWPEGQAISRQVSQGGDAPWRTVVGCPVATIRAAVVAGHRLPLIGVD